MKFNGSTKQNKWVAEILASAHLTEQQIDNLLQYAGPTLATQGIMDVIIVIEHRKNLASYANALGKFYQLSPEEKHAAALAAAGIIRAHGKMSNENTRE